MASTTKNIESLIRNRSQRLEKHLSSVFTVQLRKKIDNELYSLKISKKLSAPSAWKIFSDYWRLRLINFMKTKYLAGIVAGLAIILLLVFWQFPGRTPKGTAPELDSLLAAADKTADEANDFIQKLDNIDEQEDDEAKLASQIDELLTTTKSSGANVPVIKQTSIPKLNPKSASPTIDTADLDALLNSLDKSAQAVDQSITDFEGINENEDTIKI